MATLDMAQDLLAQLCERLGAENILAFDETGYCSIGAGDETVLHLKFDGEAILAFGVVGTLPDDEEAAGRCTQRLLAANLYWKVSEGATVALEPASGAIVLQRRIVPENIEAEQFQGILETLADQTARWQEHFDELCEEDDENPDAALSALLSEAYRA